MKTLSPKQQEIRERERQILKVAREMFFEQGYYGLTMAKIAARIECAKGTVYLHFPSKEDLIVALAEQCHERRQALFARAVQFEGRMRERMVAFAYAAELYTRLYPGDMQIFHTITPSLRQKVSRQREKSFEQMERSAMKFLVGFVQAAVDAGDLTPPEGISSGELAYGLWAIADGGFRLILSGVDLSQLDVAKPYGSLMRFVHMMADNYGWRPLYSEWDYEATLRRVQQEIFPEETQRLRGIGEFQHSI